MPQLSAISLEHFANKAWKKSSGYFFAAQKNLISVVAAELPHLIPVMPLAFVRSGSGFELVAICSLEPNVNLYIAPDGHWLGGYIPATLRGHPFSLVKVEGREDSVLCIDEESGAIVAAGQGESFFDASGAPTKAVTDILDFLSQIERNRQATQMAVEALRVAGLMQPWQINLQKEGRAVAVDGLFRVDEVAMNALPDEDFLKLRASGALAVAYSQLLSTAQLSALERLAQIQDQLKAQAAAQIMAPSGLEGLNLFQDNGTITFTY